MEILSKIAYAMIIIGIIGIIFFSTLQYIYDHSLQKHFDALEGYTLNYLKLSAFFFKMLLIGIVILIAKQL